LFHAAPNCKQKDLKNMLVDNLLPELKLKQSNILTMGDFNFYLQNKNFRFSEFMEHTSKQIVSKVTRKYESLLDLAFLNVYPAKFY
jgi:exonuclease III